jgi:hypothetical protein
MQQGVPMVTRTLSAVSMSNPVSFYSFSDQMLKFFNSFIEYVILIERITSLRFQIAYGFSRFARPPFQRPHFEIDHLNHQAGRCDFDYLIHLHCAISRLLAVALLELQNPRNDHIDTTKISARHLMDLLDHFIGRLRAESVT